MGKIALITGTNSGIGKETAIQMAKMGYSLILLMRDSENSNMAYEEIKQHANSNSIDFIPTDLSSFKSITNALNIIKSKYKTIDVIVNNAGVLKNSRQVNEDGIELTMMVNYFAPFYLTNSLIEFSGSDNIIRIVNVSSGLHKNGKYKIDEYNSDVNFSAYNTYGDTKLYLLMYSFYLARHYNNFEVFCNHPGVIATNIFRHTPRLVQGAFNLFLTSIEKGAKSNIMLATSEKLNGKSGLYYDKLEVGNHSKIADDLKLQDELYERTKIIIEKYIK